jgi:protein ImuB
LTGKAAVSIGTNHPSHRVEHLYKLFNLTLDTVAPGMGIELFELDTAHTEPVSDKQSGLWAANPAADSEEVAELLDRVAGKIGNTAVRRYLPAEHFWPERSAAPTEKHQKKARSGMAHR